MDGPGLGGGLEAEQDMSIKVTDFASPPHSNENGDKDSGSMSTGDKPSSTSDKPNGVEERQRGVDTPVDRNAWDKFVDQ